MFIVKWAVAKACDGSLQARHCKSKLVQGTRQLLILYFTWLLDMFYWEVLATSHRPIFILYLLYGQITTCTHKWCRCRYSVSPRMTGNRRKYGKAFAGSSIFILTCGSQKVTQWSFETYLESFLPVCLSIIRFQLTYSNYYCLVLLAYYARNNNYPSASGALLVGSGLVLSGFIEGHVSMTKYCKLY